MQKYRKWITVMCVLFMMLGSTSVAFGKSQIVKTYDFHPKTASNLTYDAPKTITEDGKKYELTDVSYKINKKKTIEKVQTITTRSKDDYPKTLTETISGKEVTLKATGDVDVAKYEYPSSAQLFAGAVEHLLASDSKRHKSCNQRS